MSAAGLLPTAHAKASADPSGSARFLHVGGYAPLGGLYSFAVGADGGLQPLGITPDSHSPTWLLADAGRRLVYATEEGADHISVHAQDDAGRLQPRQRLPSGGRGPVHLALGAGQLWVAHYGSGHFAALPVAGDGSLGAARSWTGADHTTGPAQALRAPPGSIARGGHDAPHAHMIQPSPDGRWLLGTDLGRDRLIVWPLGAGAPTAPGRELALSPGSGPRHFAFNAEDPRLVYVLQEQSSTLSTVALDDDGPRLLDEITVMPAGFVGTSFASGLLVAPGGRHLYAFNRLHDSLAVLSLEQPRRPRLLDHHWVHGSTPRSACRVGSHLYVCNQRSDHVSHFDLSRPDQPRFSGRQWAVPEPAGICAL